MVQISILLAFFAVSLIEATFATDAPTSTTKTRPPAKPTHVGILALPQFVGLDAYGPIEFFNLATIAAGLKLSVIAKTAGVNPSHAQNTTALLAAHSIASKPDIDVLLIPGGPPNRPPISDPEILNYIRRTYPKLKYILSVCTGAELLATTGILDGRNATTNKFSWKTLTAGAPKVNWIAKARWVIDGNVWTSSGVTAGMDMVHHFISHVYQNETMADTIAAILEHNVIRNSTFDPFAEWWGAKDVPPTQF